MDDAVMTLEEVAAFLRVSDTTIYQLTRSGELPARKVGREWRYLRNSLVEWLKQGGESMEGTVQRDEFGGEYKVENGREFVALWIPMGLEEKRALIAKASKEDWSLSEKVMELVRDLQK